MNERPLPPNPGRQHKWTMVAFGLVGVVYVVVIVLGMLQN
jgi:hypothetical protein